MTAVSGMIRFFPLKQWIKRFHLDTTLPLLSLLYTNLIRSFSTQELESEIKIYFEER